MIFCIVDLPRDPEASDGSVLTDVTRVPRCAGGSVKLGAESTGGGHVMTVRSKNHDWLAQTVEEPLEPNLPICDPHHHLWDLHTARVAPRYLLDEILADVGAGHNVVSTVFIECGAMFKSDGPEPLRPIGETEFVNGIAAMSASGAYGKTRVAAGIVGMADLTLGAAVEEVLAAHVAAGGGRFRGIRHAAGWQDRTPEVNNSHTDPP